MILIWATVIEYIKYARYINLFLCKLKLACKKLLLKKALSLASKVENKTKALNEFWNYFICFIWEQLTGNCTLSVFLFTDSMLVGVTYLLWNNEGDLQMSLLTSFPCILFLCVSSSHIYVHGTRKKEKTFTFSAFHFREQPY